MSLAEIIHFEKLAKLLKLCWPLKTLRLLCEELAMPFMELMARFRDTLENDDVLLEGSQVDQLLLSSLRDFVECS